MGWGHPWILLGLILPLAAALRMRQARSQQATGYWPGLLHVTIAGRSVRYARPSRVHSTTLVLVAVSLAIVAASRPQWGVHPEQSFKQTREVLIALDLSRSMLTEDVSPSRLELAKRITGQLLDNLRGENVGLIVFSGTAFVQVPLSPDYQIIEQFIPSLNPDYMPQGGSNYAGMLDAAIDGFSDAADQDRYLFVLSDGESSTTGWESRLPDLAERRIHVVAIGIGSDDGGFIPDEWGGYLIDLDGNPVHSRLMPDNLQELAKRTRGLYRNGNALGQVEDLQLLLSETVIAGSPGGTATGQGIVLVERFKWFLFPALLLGLLSFWKQFSSRPTSRQVRPKSDSKTHQRGTSPLRKYQSEATIMVAVLLLATANEPQAHFDSEANFDVRAVFDSNPVERVRVIAEHLAEFDYDAFDLRLLVEESIRYGQDTQRTGETIEAGAIRDAIEATVIGEGIDTSIADWPYYRSQLNSMLAVVQEAAAEESAKRDRDENVDEEDETPVVTGQSSQQTAEDSFGRGAAAKTDAALGDLSADNAPTGERGKRPAPQSTRTATLRESANGRNDNDPILAFSRKRLEEIARKDSPGRVHQLLTDGTVLENQNKFDW